MIFRKKKEKEWGDERENYTEGKSGGEDEGSTTLRVRRWKLSKRIKIDKRQDLACECIWKKNGEWQIVRYIIC